MNAPVKQTIAADFCWQAKKPDAFDLMLRFIEVTPDHTGLKDEHGFLKDEHTNKRPNISFPFDKTACFYFAELAFAASYHVTTIQGEEVVQVVEANVDSIVKALQNLPAEDAVEKLKEISRAALQEREKLDGRQTDFEDAINYCKRIELYQKYNDYIADHKTKLQLATSKPPLEELRT
jgi:hypothetical protein